MRQRISAMEPRRRRRIIDVLTAVCAVAGLTLVVIGAAPAREPQRRPGQQAAADEVPLGPPGPPAPTGRAPGPPGATTGPAATRPATTGSATTGQAATGPVAGGDGAVTATTGGPTGGPAAGVGAAGGGMGASVPVHLDIPVIGVSTSLMELGLNPDGTIAVPPLRGDAPAGWYKHLATPGEVGPAVILGHVDTARDGPAVFYQLRDLRPGDEVSVRRADGTTAVFGVDRVEEYPKERFPSAEVYGAADRPVLRLITCGGTFDRMRRAYRGNVIVFATLRRTA
ncbi:class F sortase [Dactylosporangium sp. NPDC005555]|uniref:class F sortase n=1 Tax=Dactylosporangium sp. NPDC005555 TaxID=3154889 RepID=UPI0033B36709